MKVIIFIKSENKTHLEKIKILLERAGHEIILVKDVFEFLNFPKSQIAPDLGIIDFYSYNPITFDLYKHLEELNYKIPVIVYNFPLPEGCSVRSFWIQTLDTLNYNQIHTDFYSNVLDLLFPLLEEFRQSKVQLSKEETLYKRKQLISKTHDSSVTAKMSNSQLMLFSILIENQEKELSAESLLTLLNQNSKPWKQTTLLCNISRLNILFKNTKDCSYRILKSNTGYRLKSLP